LAVPVAKPAPLVLLDDCPRWLKKQHEISGTIESSILITATFALSPDEITRLVVEKIGVRRGDDGTHWTKVYIAGNTVSRRIGDYLQVLAHLRRTASWWDGRLYIIGGRARQVTAHTTHNV
jgi:hypothetical protein